MSDDLLYFSGPNAKIKAWYASSLLQDFSLKAVAGMSRTLKTNQTLKHRTIHRIAARHPHPNQPTVQKVRALENLRDR